MTPSAAVAFVRRHGVVLEGARGHEPSFAAAVAGEPIRGSWWGHPSGHEIYELTRHLHRSRAVLVCGLSRGRVTYVHRRLWPAFVRLADRLPDGALAEIRELHIESGRHRRIDVPLQDWLPVEVAAAAREMSEATAMTQVEPWISRYGT